MHRKKFALALHSRDVMVLALAAAIAGCARDESTPIAPPTKSVGVNTPPGLPEDTEHVVATHLPTKKDVVDVLTRKGPRRSDRLRGGVPCKSH